LHIKPGRPLDLYIEPAHGVSRSVFEKDLRRHVNRLEKDYPFISLHQEDNGWRITSEKRAVAKATQLGVPSQQEVDRMLAKYYITTRADAVAGRSISTDID